MWLGTEVGVDYDGFEVGVDDHGIARVRWAHGARITGELAARSMDAVAAVRGSEPGPVLVTMSGVGIPTWDARQLFAHSYGATRIALLGSSPTDRMIAGFELGTDRPSVPRRFFYTEAEALAWLLDPNDPNDPDDPPGTAPGSPLT